MILHHNLTIRGKGRISILPAGTEVRRKGSAGWENSLQLQRREGKHPPHVATRGRPQPSGHSQKPADEGEGRGAEDHWTELQEQETDRGHDQG